MSTVVWVLWPLEQNILIWMLLYQSSCNLLHGIRSDGGKSDISSRVPSDPFPRDDLVDFIFSNFQDPLNSSWLPLPMVEDLYTQTIVFCLIL